MSTADITLCCVDTEHNMLSAGALRLSGHYLPFAKTIFVTDKPEFVEQGWEHHRIKTIADYEEYNRFMLKNLYFHIETDHVLSIQFDGFILNPEAWTDEFLAFDYIGAPWPNARRDYAVGTGGFSLRSRKLLKALQDDHIVLPPFSVAEDLCICRTYRSYLEVHYGINFAPVEVAMRFCYESGPHVRDTFGFHGLARLADFYLGDNAAFLADNLKSYLLGKVQVVVLALQYAFREQHAEAQFIFDRIAQHQTYEIARDQLIAADAPAATVEFLAVSWPRYVHRHAA